MVRLAQGYSYVEVSSQHEGKPTSYLTGVVKNMPYLLYVRTTLGRGSMNTHCHHG
jgi:hypothetical protein